MRIISLISTTILTIVITSLASASSIGQTVKSDMINNDGFKIGTVILTQTTTGTLVEIKVSGLKAGKHGMHFHKVGTCRDHNHFQMAQGHIMPSQKPHGFLNNKGGPHEGNLPNLIVNKDGTAHVELFTETVSLLPLDDKPTLQDQDGSALIIHENPDDHITQPIGGSGRRIACAKIIGNQ